MMLLLLALVIVAVLIARKPRHKYLRPVAQINSADLYLCIRRAAKEAR